MKQFKILFLTLLSSILFVGCHKRDAVESLKGEAVQQVIDANVSDTVPQFHYMTATFTCEALGVKANGLLRMAADSIIWVSVSKVVDLGRAKFTPDSVWVYVPLRNMYYSCPYSYIKERFDVTVDFQMLQSMAVEKAEAGNKFTIPVRTSILNEDVKFSIGKVGNPEQLSFPFSIPSGAKRMSMSMFD